MEVIFGTYFFNPKEKNSSSLEEDVFSLYGKRPIFKRETSWGFLYSSFEISEDKYFCGIEGSNFLEIEFQNDDCITLRNDLYGLRPLFYWKDNEKVVFSSEIENLLAVIPVSLNKSSIDEYLKQGVLFGPETFVEDVRNLVPNSKLSINSKGIEISSGEEVAYDFIYDDNNKFDLWNTLAELIKDSTQKWIEKYKINAANLSGGSDTRLLLASLSDEQRKSFTFYTDGSPFLEEENDKDVIIAKELAEKFNLKHVVRKHVVQEITDDHTFYRSELPTIYKLSGNHGGEILGSDVLGAMEFAREFVKETEFRERYPLLVGLMFRSFFSDIYNGGVFNHWTMPHRFHSRKCAPFWDQRIISLLSNVPEHKVDYYWAYSEIFRKIYPEYMKIPFHSPIGIHHHDFPLLEVGENQKLSVPKKGAYELLEEERDLLNEVGRFKYEDLKTSDELTIMRSLKVNRWISFFVLEKKWQIY